MRLPRATQLAELELGGGRDGGGSGTPTCVRLHPGSGALVLVGTSTGVAHIVSTATGEVVQVRSGGGGGRRRERRRTTKTPGRSQTRDPSRPPSGGSSSSGAVTCVAWDEAWGEKSASGQDRVLIGHASGSVRVWDVQTATGEGRARRSAHAEARARANPL